MSNEDIGKLRIEKKQTIGQLRNRKKIAYLFIAVVILASIGIFYLKGFFTPYVAVEAITVSQIYPSQAYTLLNASGYIVAQRKAAIASKVTGRLVSLSVEEGSRLKKGDIIGRLENEDLIALERQASANLNASIFNLQVTQAELLDAKTTFNRNQELLKQGYISQAEYDASEARYKRAIAASSSAEASVNAAKAAQEVSRLNIEYTIIRSPFDGVVLTKNADIGDIVTPIGAAANAKSALVTMADMNTLQAEVDVSESNLRLIEIGQPCEIQLDALPDARFDGIVHMIVPTADRSKASVLVKVKFLEKNNAILPEMSAKVAFLSKKLNPQEKKPLTVIKSSAIIERNGKKIVYLIKDNMAKEVQITIGDTLGEMVQVIDGLNIGDRIVLSPLNRLKDGIKVKVPEK